ncbi:MAG TPA: S53 family peptidase [Streptosporangiaceae bacterium]|nr:S53 family peptidase [Streptosporangiaceae bacterium]
MRLIRQFGPARACAAAMLVVSGAATAGTAMPSAPSPIAASAHIVITPQIQIPRMRPATGPWDGYTPAQIRAAYFENPLLRSGINGKGTSIVIVDSFGSPTIRHDLATFDREFKLKTAKLTIIRPAGRIPRFRATETRLTWADETTLDVEWTHVMAPAAKIVLVETPVSENEGTSGFPQIVKSEKYVMAHHLGDVISQSFGATEETFPKGTLRPLRGAYLKAAQPSYNVTILSASGDGGATDLQTNMSSFYPRPVTSWPASDPLVTGVGGLDLALSSRGGRLAPDRVWNDPGPPPSAGGGGRSIMFSRPSFQDGVATVAGRHRAVPDVSLSASCGHPVEIYESFGGAGWSLICGTSEATPLFAGIIALADQKAGHPLGPINGYLYQMAARHERGLVDVTRGNNTVRVDKGGKQITVQGWNAVAGYDLSSGLGTINAKWFVPELVAIAKDARH